MATASVMGMGTSGGTAQGTQPTAQSQAPAAVKSFVRASMEHRESSGIDITRQIGASDQDLGSFALPAYGYVRAVHIVVLSTGGSGASTYRADAPFNVLKNIMLSEPNGAVIQQFNSGYDLYLANKYGGYRGYNDPKAQPDYSLVTAGGAFAFALRIPLELRARDALGSLPNQNAAAAFQLRMTLAANTAVWSSVPATTQPNIRVLAYMEEWDQPAVASDGVQNMTTPPAMNTTQFYSKQIYPIVAGQNAIRFTRVGNYIRNLILLYRDATGARVLNSAANWPDPAQLFYDTRPIDTVTARLWRKTMYERYGYGAGTIELVAGLDDGVFSYDFAHEFDGRVGNELNDLWLPTLSSTRLELQGSFGVAGTLEVLTNDVSVAGNVFLN